jgi:hypothetical protein
MSVYMKMERKDNAPATKRSAREFHKHQSSAYFIPFLYFDTQERPNETEFTRKDFFNVSLWRESHVMISLMKPTPHYWTFFRLGEKPVCWNAVPA